MANRIFIRDVGRNRDEIIAAFRAHGGKSGGTAARDCDMPSDARQRQRSGPSYAAAATGHDRHAGH
jgi:hypothetical protein